jgi:pimeloyl-ACP methyl ester carboxylesterase
MNSLAFSRRGSGPPLVLLHALGSSRSCWDPVVPALAERFEVISIDLPGFGGSAALPPEVEPSPARLAQSVAAFLDELGIDRPAVVGNSLGGWIALELAAIRPVAALTLLAPAGLWRRGTPMYCRISLRLTRWACRYAARTLSRLVAHFFGRILVLGQTHGRPTTVTPERARAEIAGLGTAPGYDAVLAATLHRHYRAGPPLGAPVTVAIGSRDLVLLPHTSRHLDQLPPGTRSVPLPGCGHLPMSDDPVAVIELITASARSGIEIGDRRSS